MRNLSEILSISQRPFGVLKDLWLFTYVVEKEGVGEKEVPLRLHEGLRRTTVVGMTHGSWAQP